MHFTGLLLAVAYVVVVRGQDNTCLRPCHKNLDPVCGSDGTVYANPCIMEVAGCEKQLMILAVDMSHCQPNEHIFTGGEDCHKACPYIYHQVCSADGEVYSNICEKEVADCEKGSRVAILPMSACTGGLNTEDTPAVSKRTTPEDGCERLCQQNYDPVCATDGVVYSNLCEKEVADCKKGRQMALFPMFVCTGFSSSYSMLGASSDCPDACIQILLPVCGSDGKVYVNGCELQRAACTSNTEIEAVGMDKCNSNTDPAYGAECPDACIQILLPVCGSDGKVYVNGCELQKTACTLNTLIEAVEMEKCNPNTAYGAECPDGCIQIFLPVCGSDGKVYVNGCELQRAACTSNTEIEAVEMERCNSNTAYGAECPDGCIQIFLPVCGSDGKVYVNGCELQRAACTSNTEIEAVDMEKCNSNTGQHGSMSNSGCMKLCTKEYAPVCASDGKVYGNKCLKEIADCEAGDTLDVLPLENCQPPPTENCDTPCTLEYAPVFASDGNIYPNLCSKKIADCKAGEEMEVLPRENCLPVIDDLGCTRPCSKDYRPVCASDGNVYSNMCLKEIADCENGSITDVLDMSECM